MHERGIPLLTVSATSFQDQTEEVEWPVFRVAFWSSHGDSLAWRAEEREITGADLDEVLDWIATNRAGRQYSLWVAVKNPDGVTHVRLQGRDPTVPLESAAG